MGSDDLLASARLHDIGEVVIEVVEVVLIDGPGAPAGHAAQTELPLLDLQYGEGTLHKVAAVALMSVFVGSVIEVLCQVGQGAASSA